MPGPPPPARERRGGGGDVPTLFTNACVRELQPEQVSGGIEALCSPSARECQRCGSPQRLNQMEY
jgi:hypothetical protein